jgi:hypothetical protein
VRYSGIDHTLVDDGYPRTIAGSLAGELGVSALPDEFCDGIDAALRAGDGRVFLFRGPQYLEAGSEMRVAPVRGAWGVVRNDFRIAPGGLDAAFVAPSGELYAFAGGQYVRYSAGVPDTVDEGFPRLIRDAWEELPAPFQDGIDTAFTLDGRVYLGRGEEYVRYDGDRPATVDRGYPQPFRYRWCAAADYRLTDVYTIARVAQLARAHSDGDGGLGAFLAPGARVLADPYTYLADQFGWDADELKWCRRHIALLSGATTGAEDDDQDLGWNFLLSLVDLFAVASRLGTGPSRVFTDVWSRVYPVAGPPAEAELAAAADALADLLRRRTDPQQWPILADRLRDELNMAKRDALLATVLARAGARITSRDLFDRFLIDVDMGSHAGTSRVREATAATQLYLNRYLLHLESPDGDEAARQRVRSWWPWMRAYRLWQANRRVFLYPENYLRPELRTTRTPAFAALEQNLLQGEITTPAVEQAFKRYLDDYTEVSRLAIAGGYVYTKDRDASGPWRLVLFGRTRTDPRRYYYRLAEFADREKLSAAWQPWQPVGPQIDADQVHPVHAFGRVFVFWAVAEPVRDASDAVTTVVAHTTGNTQRVAPPTPRQRVKIMYSFYNLTQDWVPAQTLGVGPAETGVVSDVTLLVQPRVKPDGERTSVVVSCSYTVTDSSADPAGRHGSALFELNPELYADDLSTATDANAVAIGLAIEEAQAATATAARVARIFVDPVDPGSVVRFDAPTGSQAWFSVDHLGGSFLCRPVVVTDRAAPVATRLAGNPDRFPQWAAVHAAVELPDGTRYFFDNSAHHYVAVPPQGDVGESADIAARWGRPRSVLPAPGPVDAVLRRGDHTFVFSGESYLRFTGTPFLEADGGYPRRLAGNDERLPGWPRVDVAFTGADGVEYFGSRERGEYVTSAELEKPRPLHDLWLSHGAPHEVTSLGPVLVTDTHTYVVWEDSYIRYTHPTPATQDTPPYREPDPGYPKPLDGNPDGLPTEYAIGAALWRDGATYFFDNAGGVYHEFAPDGAEESWPISAGSAIARTGTVTAAWAVPGHLYLAAGTEYVRYTLDADGTVPALVDTGYPKPLPLPVDTVLPRGTDLYLFHGDRYTCVTPGQEPIVAPPALPVSGAWAGLPRTAPTPFDAALATVTDLYLFVGDEYLRYSLTDPVLRPCELARLPFEIIRLTTGTASTLNQKLLSGGVPALLNLATQETDELAFSTDPEATTAVRVRPSMVDVERLPTGSHLDFRSANGIYYQEIFFHAPWLIAQALNSVQNYQDARTWYEYIFDPTQPRSYWRYLPFLAIDLAALADDLDRDVAGLQALEMGAGDVRAALAPVVAALRTLAPAVAQNRQPSTEPERTALATATAPATHRAVAVAVAALTARTDLSDVQRTAVTDLSEHSLLAADLQQQLDLIGDRDSLLAAYRDDPFDPHAIAALRPIAYRRAIVMAYIGNLLDWGDMLFTQYTPETVDEARMLYVYAYDLLGARPEQLGTRLPEPAESLEELEKTPGLDLLGYLTGGGVMIEHAGAVHAGVASGYFEIPGNSLFNDYWTRATDRLTKIQQSLNILGASQPLPLFSPPIDPMQLVSAVASGEGQDALAALSPVAVPPYRFSFLFMRAQELVDRLRQLGNDLLSVLERGSAEELSQLQARQEQEVQNLTRAIKQAQISSAQETVAELTASLAGAQSRATHYNSLIDTGMSAYEKAQIGLQSTAASLHMAAGVVKIASSIAHAVPEFYAGPFIVGVEEGGRALGDTLDKISESSDTLAGGFGTIGEVMAIQAQFLRLSQDWQVQVLTAQSDVDQIGHQLAGAQQQLVSAQRDADVLELEIANNQTTAAFLRDKFPSAALYSWLAGRLGALYLQAYHLAYETARAAEQALLYECGLTDTAANRVIQPAYWENRRKGLLAGEVLAVDLERLAAARQARSARGLEITRQVSLLALDPVAMLRLRSEGTCDFSLSEELFDEDFPGHFRRQIRTITVAFTDADDQSVAVNATLTQLTHKTVLEADPQAVKYLLDPQGTMPAKIRGEWMAGQQIALSQPDGGRENNGLFELRFDDDRYLPFEGTGAVSTWRLQRSGRPQATLYDVTIIVKYTAQQGGDTFANAVKGMLRPYPAARFFDVSRDFSQQWTDFMSNGAQQLVLPLTADMFPNLTGRQITGIYPTYDEVDGGGTRLLLGGDPAMALDEATLLPTPALTLRGTTPAGLSFTVDGDKQNLRNVGLVLTYQAGVQ